MKVYEFLLKFHWGSFLGVQLIIFQQWFRWWLGTDKATSHYMNQWWLDYQCIYVPLGRNELMTYLRWTLCKIQSSHSNKNFYLKVFFSIFQDINVKCVAILNDTVGCLMSCAFHEHSCEIGVILGENKFQDDFCHSVSFVSIAPSWSRKLTHWGRHRMATSLHTAFSNAFYWTKMYEFWLRFN